jgi:PAS domain S-box-containing protein
MDASKKSKKELTEDIQSLRSQLKEFEQSKPTPAQPRSPMQESGQQTAAFAYDITERKRTENALQENMIRYRELFDHMSSGVAVYEPVENGSDFVFRNLNRAGEQINEVKKEDIVGKKVTEAFPGVEEFGLLDVFRRVYKTGKPQHHPVTLYKDDRTSAWFDNYVYKLPSGEIVAVHDDVTERKQAEEALKQSEVKFRGTFEQAAVGIAHVAPDGHFIRVNQRLCDIVGYTQEELLRKTFQDITHPDDLKADLEYVRQVLADEIKTYSMEKRYYRKDDLIVWINLTVSLIRNESGEPEYFIPVIEDITERKEAEQKLVISQNNLRTLASRLIATEEEQRRQIASNLHDDVSQLLALSVNQLQKLRGSVGLADARTLDNTRQTLEEVIEHVRDLTFDLGSPTLYKLGLKAAIFEFLDERLRDHHAITCEFSGDDTDKLLDSNIRVLLFQAVRELLINVIKHAKANRVEVAVGRKGEDIQICVSDDGIGFDTKITEAPMQRTGGFGLFNIQNQLDLIGGSFEMHSQLGSGSHFTLTAPLKTKTDLAGEKCDGSENSISG